MHNMQNMSNMTDMHNMHVYTPSFDMQNIYPPPPPLICSNMQNMQNNMQNMHPVFILEKIKNMSKIGNMHLKPGLPAASRPGLRFHDKALYA